MSHIETVQGIYAAFGRGDLTAIATPLAKQGSGSLPSIHAVDALAVLPESTSALPEGMEIDVLLLGDESGREEPLFT